MDSQPSSIAQRSAEKLRFDHKDMDYYYSWILGREVYEGADLAECERAAEDIIDGSPASWREAWAALARRVEAQAAAALQAGDRETARRAYLRACTYYRGPLFIMLPTDPAFEATQRQMQACFQQAAALFHPPLEAVTVPFRGQHLTGWFWRAAGDSTPRPTLIVVGGIETWAEDCYFMVGPAGPQRGFHVLTVDLPGQGRTPSQGLFFEARMGPAVSAVIDYALSRAEVDPQRLALFGFSWGGHIVFKGAQHEAPAGRVKALIANPAMPDLFRQVRAQQGGNARSDPVAWQAFQQIAWRLGLRISLNLGDIARRFGKAYDYLRYGKADPREITCPVLCLAGEGEAKITLDVARECYAQLPNPQKKLVIFTKAQGGEAHCQVNNLPLPNGVMFDWLEEVFADGTQT